jgi:hypothetical protein
VALKGEVDIVLFLVCGGLELKLETKERMWEILAVVFNFLISLSKRWSEIYWRERATWIAILNLNFKGGGQHF